MRPNDSLRQIAPTLRSAALVAAKGGMAGVVPSSEAPRDPGEHDMIQPAA
ncbi:hypothetical protein [Arthrobacter sp. H-02-3]|nr:hypothetical protein [Arthrobacter sp. H-02-3]